MNFFKNVLASTLGVIVATLILSSFFLIIIAGIASFISSENGSFESITEGSILSLDLNLPIVENPPSIQKFQKSLGLKEDIIDIQTILNSIKIANHDDRIKGISINSGMLQAGWAQTKTIRDALKRFKESGKFIYSFSDFYTQKGYYLASIADSIFINTLGGIELKGLASEVLYYKDFQDKYGFKMEVVRNGKYKSAVEPYLENTMSKENRIQLKTLIEDYWSIISSEISNDRGIAIDKINSIAENIEASTSRIAIKLKLIDKDLYLDDYINSLRNAAKIDSIIDLDRITADRLVGLVPLYKKGVRDLIAIIYAQGTILYGEGSHTSIGQDVFVDAIEEASNDKRIKAIVLRINSPGGSAITSDIIWNSIEKAKLKKPIVVSMGDVAASGGYYIACNANKIIANPFTVTGSIGVFAVLPNIAKVSESLGINAQHVTTHKNALGYSVFEEISPGFKKSIKEGIMDIYSTFKNKVSKGRNIPIETVEEIAQGRIWTGGQALENGLIDQLGSLDDALAAAAELSKIEDYNIATYPRIEPNIENILKIDFPLSALKLNRVKNMNEGLQYLLDEFTDLNNGIKYQAQLPFSIKID
tara:strand:+ start:4028 stop:5797 length:1770 start_codon:yes stop_codon:yes gene_type:complete